MRSVTNGSYNKSENAGLPSPGGARELSTSRRVGRCKANSSIPTDRLLLRIFGSIVKMSYLAGAGGKSYEQGMEDLDRTGYNWPSLCNGYGRGSAKPVSGGGPRRV